MLSQPIFGDRALSDSLYRALINRFYDSLNLSTQTLLGECTLGFAPSPEGVKTFFIVAPSPAQAEQVIQEMDSIVNRVATLMAGVGQIAVCINPTASQEQQQMSCGENPAIPQYMACKFFEILDENETIDA
ncbi:MAG: hypothetical protein ACM37W_11810 [Actinomycetota bacterium]